MDPMLTINKITTKISPGRWPSYTDAHVLMALQMIGSKKGVGRQQLSQELQLGEGMIRTMVKRMKNVGVIKTSRGGMTLTNKGRETLNAISEVVKMIEFPKTQLTVGSSNYAVLIKNKAEKIKKGIEQRDIALIAGAEGATTLVFNGDQLLMPGTETVLETSTNRYIQERMKPFKGDVIIIGTANNSFKAKLGAISSALELLKNKE